jgi:branched-subunit amino acid transport protein
VNEFALILGMAGVTYLIRYIMVPLSGRVTFSFRVERALRYVPVAVLSAIIVPAVLAPNGPTLQLGFHNAYLVGAVAACAVSALRKNLLLTIVVSMAVFLLWQALICAA